MAEPKIPPKQIATPKPKPAQELARTDTRKAADEPSVAACRAKEKADRAKPATWNDSYARSEYDSAVKAPFVAMERAQKLQTLPPDVKQALTGAQTTLADWRSAADENSSISRCGGTPNYDRERQLTKDLTKQAAVIGNFYPNEIGSLDYGSAAGMLQRQVESAQGRLDSIDDAWEIKSLNLRPQADRFFREEKAKLNRPQQGTSSLGTAPSTTPIAAPASPLPPSPNLKPGTLDSGDPAFNDLMRRMGVQGY